jgi:hypothetical protein
MLSLMSVAVALSMLVFWGVSSDASWSSAPWLIYAAMAVAISGPIAVVLLLVLFLVRAIRKK